MNDTHEHKIIHHTKKAIQHVRSKPYETRMHIIRFVTVFCSLLVVFIWIFLLKRQFALDSDVQTIEVKKRTLIKEGVIKVYNNSTERIQNLINQ